MAAAHSPHCLASEAAWAATSSSEIICSSNSPSHAGMAAVDVKVEHSGLLSYKCSAVEACCFSSSIHTFIQVGESQQGRHSVCKSRRFFSPETSFIKHAFNQGRQVGSGQPAAGSSSYSHVLEDIWGGEANVVSQHGLHVVLPGAKDLDLPNVGVSPILVVADHCQLHKVRLQVFPADEKQTCCVVLICSCRACGWHLHVLTEPAARLNTAGRHAELARRCGRALPPRGSWPELTFCQQA